MVRQTSAATTTLGLLVAVAALYFGREVCIPLALAVLLSFALAPPVLWLRRLRLGRAPAVILVVAVAFAAIFAFAAVVTTQVASLAENLPEYQRNLQSKLRSLQGAGSAGAVIERARGMLKDLEDEVADTQRTDEAQRPAASGAQDPIRRAVPVQIQQPDPAPLQAIQQLIGPLLEPLATSGVVIVFVIFMLLQREDLRDRFIRLAGAHDLQRTTLALNEAGERVSRYLLAQLLVNATYAIPVGVGLYLIGIPNAALWGILAMVLRFVPYIGPFIGALFPLALSLAVDPGWSLLLWTAALFVVLELVSNNVVEPWLYGASTGLSSIAVIVSAVFWTWLWGPIGLLLSTPLTVCLVVLGRHVPQLGFLDVLLGSQPVLAPEERFYQRMLADDPVEGLELAENYLSDKPLIAFYDEVALPALALAEQDRRKKTMDEDRRERLAAAMMAVIEELDDHEDVETAAPPPSGPVPPDADAGAAPSPPARPRVLCIAGRSEFDAVATAMLAQLLERRGIEARTMTAEATTRTGLAKVDLQAVDAVCLSYVNTSVHAHAHNLSKRFRRRWPGVAIVACLWSLAHGETEGREPGADLGVDAVVRSMAQALKQVETKLAERQRTPARSMAPPADGGATGTTA